MKKWMALLLCMTMMWGTAEAETTRKVDIDLSRMNSVMFTGELNQMYMNMDAYIGKVIRMSGVYNAYAGFDEQGNVNRDLIYHVCEIADATACCVQGVEFILAEGAAYPEPGAWITIVGTFGVYEEYGYLYFHLTDTLLEQ